MGLCNISSRAPVGLVVLAMVHSSLAQNSEQDFLKAHNTAQSAVDVVPMRWDTTLATYAQKCQTSDQPRRINMIFSIFIKKKFKFKQKFKFSLIKIN